MNMTPEVVAALVFGVPLAIMAGGVIQNLMILVIGGAMLFYSPLVGIGMVLIWAVALFFPWFLAGLGFGLGAGRGARR